jgi:hypothetical protein
MSFGFNIDDLAKGFPVPTTPFQAGYPSTISKKEMKENFTTNEHMWLLNQQAMNKKLIELINHFYSEEMY